MRSANRSANIIRKTRETKISVSLNVDGSGKYSIDTGIKFLDHMLELFSRHGLFDLDITARGDLRVDQHHTVEDIGIALGLAFGKALGKKIGISRAGYFVYPMDESLSVVSVDIGGRPFTKFDVDIGSEKVGDLEAGLLEDFFIAFSNSLKCSLHIVIPYGRNPHHKVEAVFKAFAKAMMTACSMTRSKSIPSTKGRI